MGPTAPICGDRISWAHGRWWRRVPTRPAASSRRASALTIRPTPKPITRSPASDQPTRRRKALVRSSCALPKKKKIEHQEKNNKNKKKQEKQTRETKKTYQTRKTDQTETKDNKKKK